MTYISHDLLFGFARSNRHPFGLILLLAICFWASSANAWKLNDRTPTDPTTGKPILAGVVGLTGYISSSPDQQHVDFIGLDDGHVHELVFSGGGWNHFDLFSSARIPTQGRNAIRAAGGLVGYTTPGQQHVVFIGSDANIHELVFSGGQWRHTNLTTLPTVLDKTPASETAIDAYTSSGPDQQHVNFVGIDHHVHELVFSGGHWSGFDLFTKAGVPTVGANAVFAAAFRLDGYTSSSPNQQHVNFVDTNQHVRELVFDGGAWSHFDLFNSAGVSTVGANAVAADVLAGLAGYISTSPDQQHVDFVGADHHVHELMFDGSWHHSDLTKDTGMALVAGCGIAADVTPDGQQHINFVTSDQGNNGHINQLFFANPPGRWRLLDLGQLVTPSAPPPAALTAGFYCLNGYTTPNQHLNFIDTNEHIFEIFD